MPKQARRSRRDNSQPELTVVPVEQPVSIRKAGPLVLLTQNQKTYANSVRNNALTFSTGPAGVGKSYIALSLAAQMLEAKQIERIVIVRPLVEAGEKVGHLPGELSNKLEPWVLPMMDILRERLGSTYVDYLLKFDRIRVSPLAFMRGSTLKNAFVLLTEAQNTTPAQMEMFLTRLGEDVRVVVDGCLTQSDIRGQNGLADAVNLLSDLNGVGHVEFTRSDIVRSGLCQKIVERYEGCDEAR